MTLAVAPKLQWDDIKHLWWRELPEDQLVHKGRHDGACVGPHPEHPVAVPVVPRQGWPEGSCRVDAAHSKTFRSVDSIAQMLKWRTVSTVLRCNSLLAWHTRRRLFTATCAATIDCGPLPAAINWHSHKMAEQHSHANSQRGQHLQAVCILIRQYMQGPRVKHPAMRHWHHYQ